MERVYNFISLSKFIIPVTHWNGKIDVQQNTNATPSGMPHRDELIGLYLQKKKMGPWPGTTWANYTAISNSINDLLSKLLTCKMFWTAERSSRSL
jgi:hypothetical protein